MTAIGPQVPIRYLRKAHRMTLAELADRMEPYLGKPIDQNSLSNIERGTRPVSDRVIHAWARALDVDPLDVTKHPNPDAARDAESAA